MFFAGDGRADSSEALVVDQAVDLVAGCEFAFYALLVFQGASYEVSGYAGVKGFGAVGHYVDVVGARCGGHGLYGDGGLESCL